MLSVFLTLFYTAVQAQIQPLSGRIYDAQTRQPLAGVTLIDTNKKVLTVTDATGFFKFAVTPDISFITAALKGYKTQMIKLSPAAGEAHIFNVQMEVDAVSLNEVHVEGYYANKTNKETAGSIALVTLRDINRGNAVSLQPAFNGIAGVRMEQSTLSEARISIRGNGLRASFGSRNIKIYVNEIPVTEADGTTRIEALDVNSIGRAEIIKGPASSLYGAGTGGVINFQLQRSPYQEQSLDLSALAGSDGLYRLSSSYRNGGDKLNSFVSYGWQEYGGYRQHSNDMRRFLTGNFQLFPSDQRMITLMVNRTTQHTQIPGTLTQAQVDADRKQANATNLDKVAGRYQNWTRVGLGQQYLFSKQFANTTSIFTYFYDLNHPLAFTYIRNYYQSYGGRTRFTFDPDFALFKTRFSLGAEFNEGLTKGMQYINNKGVEGAVMTNIDYKNTQYSIFYQSETQLGLQTMLTLGLSYNSLDYDIRDYLKPAQTGVKKFEPQATPRIALSHTFNPSLSIHGSVSAGFSPPTASEIKNADGSINGNVQAEEGINYEFNAKGNLLKKRLEYDLSLFLLDIKGELIGQAVQQGITVFTNAGKTRHAGAELSMSYQMIKPEDGFTITSFRPFAALTYSDFSFEDYKVLDPMGKPKAVYDNHRLTGVAPWLIHTGIDIESRTGVYLFGSYFYSDRLPLNDANTAFNPSYDVLNAKIGYRTQFFKRFETNVYFGLDNIFKERYSSILSLNAVGFNGGASPYFNPSPGRTAYGGMIFKYNF